MTYFIANPSHKSLLSFELKDCNDLHIGRHGIQDVCSISIPISMVSRSHALVYFKESRYFLKDLDSSNGSFINGHRITNQVLNYGDKVSFGDKHLYHFVFSEIKEVQKSESTIESYHEYSFNLSEKSNISVGRANTNDIILSNEVTASGLHAEIYACKNGYKVRDCGSTNGTFVNGKKIKSKKIVADDVVFIGSSLLRISINHDTIYVSVSKWNNSVHLECVSLNKVVGDNINILSDINLSIAPGEFVGILGPSGAGKSTLLKALNGFSPPSSGAVLMNELALFKSYELCRNLIGYVPQDDVIYKEMSVTETLLYVARLRLPKDQSDQEIKCLVVNTLKKLRLDHVATSKVSSLSGGQRKRVSVGAELLTNPALLFLDEPTSGLDPSTEEKLMLHLREMSRNGTTILITTHILYNLGLLDKVIFLARGRVAFYGTPEEALLFFEIDGKPIEKPIQIFDLLEGEISNSGDHENTKNLADQRTNISKAYASKYRKSTYFKLYVRRCFSNFANKLFQSVRENNKNKADISTVESKQHLKLLKKPLPQKSISLNNVIPSWRELLTLIKRNFSIKFSDMKKMQIYMVVPLILGFITLSMSNEGFPTKESLEESKGSISQIVNVGIDPIDYQLRLLFSTEGASEVRSGTEIVFGMAHQTVANLPISLSTLLILVMTAIFCGALTACLELSTEKNIFFREKMAGLKTINYLLSKIPFLCILTSVQMVILVLICCIDENMRQLNLLGLVLCLIAISWVAIALGLLVSALDPSDGQFSVVIAIAVILPQLILSGALGPSYFSGFSLVVESIANILPARWGMELVLSNAFANNDTVSWVNDFVINDMGLNFDEHTYLRIAFVYLSQIALYLSLAYILLNRRSSLG